MWNVAFIAFSMIFSGPDNWAKIVNIPNLLCLSSSYRAFVGPSSCNDHRGLLTRAKLAGYTHVRGSLLWVAIPPSGAYEPFESWSADYFGEALLVADSLGLQVMPVLMTSGRSGDEMKMFEYFGDLYQNDSAHNSAPDKIMNISFDSAGYELMSSPTWKDARFDVPFANFLKKLSASYESARSKFKKVRKDSLDFLSIGFDEFGGSMGRKGALLPYINIGATSEADRSFLQNSKGGISDLAFRRLIAAGLHWRTWQVKQYFPRISGVMAFASLLDPQNLGGVPNLTYNPAVSVVLSPRGPNDSGVLDFPGLTAAEKSFVKSNLILEQWHYTITNELLHGNFSSILPLRRYVPDTTMNYFVSKGVRVISENAPVYSVAGKSRCSSIEPALSNVQSFKETIDAGMRLKSKFLGFVVSWYPEDKCGDDSTSFYPYWHSDAPIYSQNHQFDYLEIGKQFYSSTPTIE